MTPESILIPELRDRYQQDSLAIRETFERTSDGISSIHRRTTLVDGIIRRLWTELAGEPYGPPPLGRSRSALRAELREEDDVAE